MQPPAPWAAYAKGHAMRLLYYLAAAILLVMLIPILQASAFTMDSTSGTNSDGSSRFVDPDEQVRSFRRNARGASAGRGRIAPIRAQKCLGSSCLLLLRDRIAHRRWRPHERSPRAWDDWRAC